MKYRAFVKIVETGSITRAAKELGYSQPGISHMINALEKEVGFSLFKRVGNQMKPTENSKKLLEYCYQLIHEEDLLKDAVQEINGLCTGTIKIGALNSMIVNFVPKIIKKFSSEYPSINIILQEYATTELCMSLRSGSTDLAFMTDESPVGFEFSPLFEDPLCLAVHKNHPFAAYEKLSVSYLNGCDFIMPTSGWDDLVLMIQKRYPFTPTICHYTASDTAGLAMVAQELGVYVISEMQMSLLPENVVARKFREPIARTMGICAKSLKATTPAIKRFITTTYNMV